MKTLIISDIHLEIGDVVDASYETIKQVISKEKFDRIIINGDYLDLSYLSKYNEDSPLLTENKRLVNDINLLKNELKFMKRFTKDITYLSGNHSDRLETYIEKAPVLEGIVSLQAVCDEMKVEFVPTIKQPYKLLEDLYIAHGLALNKYCAANNVEKSGVSIITGHSHRTQMYTTSYLNNKPVTGYSIGCISSLSPNYVAGKRISGWSQSFGILYQDKGLWDFQIYMLKNNHCIINGKVY